MAIENEIPHLVDIDNIIEIKSINSMFSFHFKEGYKCEPQFHDPMEVIFVDKGVENVGENDKTYVLNKGEMFLHRSRAVHFDECLSETSDVYVFTFTGSSLYLEKLFDHPIALTIEQIASLKDFFNFGFNNINKETGWLYFDRYYIYDEPFYSCGASQALKNKIENFFISLINSELSKDKKESGALSDPLIAQIISVLDEEKMNAFSLDILEKKLNYSKSYLCRIFKKKMKTSLNTYFYYLKIAEAKRLLLDPSLNIETVSNRTGFDSVQYFSLVFKKYTGSSPSSWRSIYFHK